ncbi:MAG: hypothetical protein AAF823_10565 [Planctomycetota bacterium]
MIRPLTALAAAFTLVAASLLLTGCGSAASEAAAQSAADTPAARAAGANANPDAGVITVTVVNRTGRDITTVVVYGKGLGKDLGYQTISNGDSETLRHDDLRAVPKLNLDYTDYRGDRKYNSINMPRQFTDGYSGNITLTIDRSGRVRVSR